MPGTGSAPRARQARRPRTGIRGNAASAVIGPVGHILKSASAAEVLTLVARDPRHPLAFGEIVGQVGSAKGTVQTALRALVKAQLVVRERQGTHARYRYAADRPIGRAMLQVIEESRRSVTPAPSGIPWLTQIAEQPGARGLVRHGDRVEPEVSQIAAERLLEGLPPEESSAARRRPGYFARGS